MLHEFLRSVISLQTVCSCKVFKKVAKQMSVLKLLNFQDSTSTCTLDYRKHRHPKDTLFLEAEDLAVRNNPPISEAVTKEFNLFIGNMT